MGANPTFKKKILASSVSACLLASVGVAAQEDNVEEVLVTGMKASLEAAMDVKRNAVGVVDAISAEDMGKMPDANLAESLQRIAGLSINRTNGEGAEVTVRGIDPGMNMVTLNGRNMPTVTNNGTLGDKSSRAFDFAALASESVNGVQVYKTGKANVSGGGLGATINLSTIKPLEVGETKGAIGAKAVQDETVFNGNGSGEEFTPEFSGLYNWVNDEGTFGVALTGAYQERDNVRSLAFVNNWQLRTVGDATYNDDTGDQLTIDGNIPYSYDHDNDASTDNQLVSVSGLPASGGLYAIPTDLRYAIGDNHRERTNTQLTLQYRPVERVTATVDYTYSKYDLSADVAQQSTWYNQSAISSLQFDSGADVATPVIYQEAYPAAGKDVSFAQQLFSSVSESNSLGVNIAWDVTDNFNLAVDYHDSSADNVTDQTEIGLNANVVTSEYSDWSKDLPVMGVTFDDSDPNKGNGNGILDGGDVSAAIGTVGHDTQNSSINQLKIDGEWDLGNLGFFEESKIVFGIDQREDVASAFVNTGANSRITMGNWGGVDPETFGGDWPSYFTARNFGDAYPSFGGTTGDAAFLDFGLDGDVNNIIENLEYTAAIAQSRFRVNGDDPTTLDDPATTDVVENLETSYWVSQLDPNGEHWRYRETDLTPDNFNNFPNGKVQASATVDANRTIKEEVLSYYAQFQGSFEIAGMNSNLVVGVRQESTDLTSSAIVRIPDNLQWDGDNDWSIVQGSGVPEAYELKNSYDNFLPNVDFDIDVVENVKLRMSYSETMARPGYGSLKSDVSIDNPYLKQASSGNPLLEPLQSSNTDIGVEWYYGDSNYVSAVYFQKDVSNFIGNSVVASEVYGLRDVRNGPRFAAAIADIQAAGGNPNSELEQHNQMLINEGLDPADESTYIRPNSTDPIQVWDKTIPTNNKDDSISGLELSVQHWFGETGFGVQANYTAVDSGLTFDNTSTEEQFAILGLSDTANLIGFYDKDGLQARIAYNWRDKFLASTVQGGNNAPGYTDAYSQIDFSLSYDIAENVTLSLEGLNITGEDSRRYGRSSYQMFQVEDLGARYSAGVRVAF